MISWISAHSWLFGGVLVAVPIAIIGWILQIRLARRKKDGGAGGRVIKQRQKSGRNSTNIQAGNDVKDVKLDGRRTEADAEER